MYLCVCLFIRVCVVYVLHSVISECVKHLFAFVYFLVCSKQLPLCLAGHGQIDVCHALVISEVCVSVCVCLLVCVCVLCSYFTLVISKVCLMSVCVCNYFCV